MRVFLVVRKKKKRGNRCVGDLFGELKGHNGCVLAHFVFFQKNSTCFCKLRLSKAGRARIAAQAFRVSRRVSLPLRAARGASLPPTWSSPWCAPRRTAFLS